MEDRLTYKLFLKGEMDYNSNFPWRLHLSISLFPIRNLFCNLHQINAF